MTGILASKGLAYKISDFRRLMARRLACRRSATKKTVAEKPAHKNLTSRRPDPVWSALVCYSRYVLY